MSGKPAARAGDPTDCPRHGDDDNLIVDGSGDVFFDGLPAARQGDASECGGKLDDNLATTVFINGRPAATVGSVGTHGNKVTAGSGTVIIGNSHRPVPFVPSTPLVISGFDAQFQLKNGLDNPLAATKYLIRRQDGSFESGITNEFGLTHRVATHKSSEKIDIFVEG